MLAMLMPMPHSNLDCALATGLCPLTLSRTLLTLFLSSRAVLAIHADSTLQLALVSLDDGLCEGYAM